MHIETLKVFCDLVDTGSFSLAAAQNFVTQSAVSQQIRTLETRYGRKLVERAKRRVRPTPAGEIFYEISKEIVTRYHISLDVADRPGVLAAVAGVFAEHDVSIQTVRQEGRGDDATLVVVTHAAADEALTRTVADLREVTVVREVTSVMRVEGEY